MHAQMESKGQVEEKDDYDEAFFLDQPKLLTAP